MHVASICLGVLLAMAPAARANDGITVNVTEEGNGVFVVKGSFTVPSGAGTVWEVLTDYDKLGSYVPSVKSSIVKQLSPDAMLVSQESTARFMAITKTMRVLLQTQEAPRNRIFFTDVGLKDFEHFIGNWTIERDAQGTRIDYVASAKPRIYLPIWGGSIMHDMVKGQLTSLKKEILRRPATADDSARPAKPAA
jgi:carbon monoxide dehydrogenase subunit G